MTKPKQSNKEKETQSCATPKSFDSIHPPLSEGVLQYVKSQNFMRMTPVQAATIPQFLSHKDVAVQAVTGSGKTLAFLIPCIEILLKKKVPLKKQQIGALILSPTRELAQQTHLVAQGLCQACLLAPPLLLVGGASASSTTNRPVTADLQKFQELGSDIVIGTPGRVEDVLTKYAVMDCSDMECLVLDEADVLLNMGFSTTLQHILSKLPKMRRTGLFSATTASSTHSNLREWMHRVGMRNPIWIDVAVTTNRSEVSAKAQGDDTERKMPAVISQERRQQATPSSLVNYYIITPLHEKVSRLAAFLKQHRDEKMIVFFLTCACVDFFGTALPKLLPDSYVEPLHGKMVQTRREKALERFRMCGRNLEIENAPKGGALFCTDVAARGLDVTDVQWVVQFDAPQDPAVFVHRVGRAARAGRPGSSLIFLTRKEEAYVDLLGMRKVPLSKLPSDEHCCPPELETDDKDIDESDPQRKEVASPQLIDGIIRSAAGSDIILDDYLPQIRKLVLRDRDILEKGTKAFTSYIRAYKEHHCAFIFRFASLDLGSLATSFCLLRLPKMPELTDVVQKHKGKVPNFAPAGADVDIFAIPYLDKAREAARQKRLQQEMEAGGKNAKLIKAERRKAEKELKAKEIRKKAIEKGRNPDKKRGRHAQLVDEWDDLAKEERLYKKLRKGKISQEVFDKEMFGGDI